MKRNAEQQLSTWLGSKERKPWLFVSTASCNQHLFDYLRIARQNLLEVISKTQKHGKGIFINGCNTILHEAEVLCAKVLLIPKQHTLSRRNPAVPKHSGIALLLWRAAWCSVIAAGSLLEFALEKQLFHACRSHRIFVYYPWRSKSFFPPQETCCSTNALICSATVSTTGQITLLYCAIISL